MITVFEINLNPRVLSNLLIFKIVLGVLGSISILVLCVSLFKKFTIKTNSRVFVALLISITGWMILPPIPEIINMGNERLKPYYSLNHEITRGIVKVLREQPKAGRAPGDLVKVDKKIFEISYSVSNPFYSIPISRGGYLKEDSLVELHHVKNKIFRIDIDQTETE